MGVSIFDVLKLRNFTAARQFLYAVTPVLLIALHVTHVDLWSGLALAALAPALAMVNTVDGFRTWFYGVIAAGQAVLLGLNVFTDVQLTPWIAVITAVVGSSVALKYSSVAPE